MTEADAHFQPFCSFEKGLLALLEITIVNLNMFQVHKKNRLKDIFACIYKKENFLSSF